MGKIDDVLASIARAQQDAQSAQTALLDAAKQAQQVEAGYAALCALGDRSRVEQLRNELRETIGEISQLSTQTEKLATGFALIKNSGDLTPGIGFGKSTAAPATGNAPVAGTRPLWPSELHPLRGTVSVVPKNRNARAISPENQSAVALARHGYDVLQNPAPRGGKEPDYLIQGEYWDCYSLSTDNAASIRKKISEKVGEEQAERYWVRSPCPR